MARPATGIVKEKLNITLSRGIKEELTRMAHEDMISISSLIERWTKDELEEQKRNADNVAELHKAKNSNGVMVSVLVSVSDKENLEKLQAIAEANSTSIETLLQDKVRSKQAEFINSCIAELMNEEV